MDDAGKGAGDLILSRRVGLGMANGGLKYRRKDGSGWDDGGQHHAGHISQCDEDFVLALPNIVKIIVGVSPQR